MSRRRVIVNIAKIAAFTGALAVAATSLQAANIKIKVGRTTGASGFHIPSYIAMDRGFFKREGLDASYVAMGGKALITAGMGGAIDFVPIPGGDVNDASQIERFQFKPSLALRITELESAGSASGEVVDESDAPLAGAAVSAFLGDVEVTTTATAEDGSYMLSGLEPGTYSIAYSLTGFANETAPDVQVTAGADTSIDPVMLVAESP